MRILSKLSHSFPAILALLLLTSCNKDEHKVELSYMDSEKAARQLPFWTPRKIDFLSADSATFNFTLPHALPRPALFADLHIGKFASLKRLLFAKSDSNANYFDILFIDKNNDSDFSNDGPPFASESRYIPNRNRHLTEFKRVSISFMADSTKPSRIDSMLTTLYFWYPSIGLPSHLFITHESWRQGTFKQNDVPVSIILTDDNIDGIFDSRDRWALLPESTMTGNQLGTRFDYRDAGEFGWVDNISYKIINIASDGFGVTIKKEQLGITKELDYLRDSPYPEEARRPRAARGIHWRTNLESAKRMALKARKNILLHFYVNWSGPNTVLEERTFQDAEIVALADELVCVQLDGDKNKPLMDQFEIKQFPTLILVTPRGKELARAIGYQPAAILSKFIKQYRTAK